MAGEDDERLVNRRGHELGRVSRGWSLVCEEEEMMYDILFHPDNDEQRTEAGSVGWRSQCRDDHKKCA